MFISTMSTDQQAALLYVAELIMHADGAAAESESVVYNSILAQCDYGVEKKPTDLEELSSIFSSKPARLGLLLELLGVAHADGEFHQSESQMIGQIAHILNVDQTLLGKLNSWVIRQFDLMKEAKAFMEEA